MNFTEFEIKRIVDALQIKKHIHLKNASIHASMYKHFPETLVAIDAFYDSLIKKISSLELVASSVETDELHQILSKNTPETVQKLLAESNN